MERHYGMDWLRIGAFGLLIFYHIGMVFVPWGWHVKTADPIEWTVIPMFATNGWRLTLLFVVSGFASRALWAKAPTAGGFVGNRTARLLVPLLFGIIIVIPPQPWIELVTQHGYAGSLSTFWLHDYFRFGTLGGIVLPTWQHLWFVLYLWVYTLALALLLLIPGGGRVQALFDRIFAGSAVLWLPMLWLFLLRVVLFPSEMQQHDLINDLPWHLTNLPALLFGFALAGSPATMAAIGSWWKIAGVIAIASYAVIAAIFLIWPDDASWTATIADAFHHARAINPWAAIVALIGVADRFWNRDHAWRPMLTEAVFPFYIIHQTIIVVAGWWLLRVALPSGVEFAVLVIATVAGCWAFYLVGRSVSCLRPLIGLRRVASRRPSGDSAVPKEA